MSDDGDLAARLGVAPLDRDVFRGFCPPSSWRRIFGGLVIGQSIAAMARTVEARPLHSLHAYFLIAGNPAVPIDYAVERLRDGGSFSTRRCVGSQGGQAIVTVTASFQKVETGLSHADRMPDVPSPEDLADEAEILRRFGAEMPKPALRYLAAPRPVEIRPVALRQFLRLEPPGRDGGQAVWMRCRARLPADLALRAAALGYMSDMTLLDAALLHHRRSVFDPTLQVASLDHAMWVHEPDLPDGWMLYVEDSPWSGGGRGLARGRFFGRDGALLASVAQEGLIRQRLSELSDASA
ncbi:MAG: acyl-CoA thioesterase II [Parafilimonas terrae]|nr:acyl-CoA thioesterase II [Parafilimonas terrae]